MIRPTDLASGGAFVTLRPPSNSDAVSNDNGHAAKIADNFGGWFEASADIRLSAAPQSGSVDSHASNVLAHLCADPLTR